MKSCQLGVDARRDYEITLDGSRVVFCGNLVTEAVDELFSAPIAGGERITLSGNVVAGGSVGNFQVSRDGKYVVFYGNLEADAAYELFSAPIATANARVKLSGDRVTGGGPYPNYRISPDSSHVVFRGNLVSSDLVELFSAQISGGGRKNLSGDGVTGFGITQFRVSPDSRYVVFTGSIPSANLTGLFSAPVGGGVRASLSVADNAPVTVANFEITPDSANVVFVGPRNTDGYSGIYSAPIMGGSRPPLSGVPVANRGVDWNYFQISPDSAHVAYRGNFESEQRYKLYSSPIVGGIRADLSGDIVAGGFVNDDFRISSDSSYVVFRAFADSLDTLELFSAPVMGGERKKLSGSVVTDGDVYGDFQVSPDSSRVVFVGDLITHRSSELFSTPILGGSRATLSGTMKSLSGVRNFQINQDGSRVLFIADKEVVGTDELFRVQIGGTAFSLDVDGDDRVLPLTDLLMLTRYQLGMRGAALIANALGDNATVTNVATIEHRIRAALEKSQ